MTDTLSQGSKDRGQPGSSVDGLSTVGLSKLCPRPRRDMISRQRDSLGEVR